MCSSNVKYHTCPWASSSVNVANFVTVKPSLQETEGSDDERSNNFKIWKDQMLCLLESQDVAGFVGSGGGGDCSDEQKQWRRTDRLVKGWILASLGKDVLEAVWEKQTAMDVWLELHSIFNSKKAAPQIHHNLQKSINDVKHYYAWPSSVNAANFVTVTPWLKGINKRRNSFKIWKEQMLCLLESHGVLGFVDGRINQPPPDQSGETRSMLFRPRKLPWMSAGEDLSRFLPVCQAAQRGDWDTVQNFFEDVNELSTTIITTYSETALHLAVLTGKANDLVKKLVELTPAGALALKNCSGKTALHNAAIVGNTEAAKMLVDKNPGLLDISCNFNRLAVIEATVMCHKETLEYLISEHEKHSPPCFQGQLGIRLLNAIITSEFVDIALHLAYKYPNLATLRDTRDGHSALSIIAGTPNLFPRTETFIYHVPKVKEMREKKARREEALQLVEYLCRLIVSLPENEAAIIFERSIIEAARNGISEIVEMIIHNYPNVTFYEDFDGRNVFLMAASNRFENVINLIYNMSNVKYMLFDRVDYHGNNLMHICGKLAPPHRLNLVAGAALQMQRELQWFKEMENFVNPSRRTWVNADDQTPQMIFTKEHESLKAEGERWMKDTANACTIAAALIATVVFAAAFTVPGGVESATGIPLFSGKPAFMLFAISDAVSLFTSITSLLMFLSILTSRYAEQDFLYVLPKRLSIGLLSLFVSITFMMVAFSSTFYLVFHGDGACGFLILVAALACLPVTSFVLLQFPLLVDVVYSTYGPGIFGKKSDRVIY
ncbi:hypothetical protein C2S52_019093 [Perilla frutescens var. hirtella]|nr:hypothetical protein C2S52_019093 [Perilla frutescens var. hirtella]